MVRGQGQALPQIMGRPGSNKLQAVVHLAALFLPESKLVQIVGLGVVYTVSDFDVVFAHLSISFFLPKSKAPKLEARMCPGFEQTLIKQTRILVNASWTASQSRVPPSL